MKHFKYNGVLLFVNITIVQMYAEDIKGFPGSLLFRLLKAGTQPRDWTLFMVLAFDAFRSRVK